MILNIYSVKDEANGFVSPQLYPNHYAAQRAFSHAMRNDSALNAFPDDFGLYYIGEWNTDEGIVSYCSPPVRIVTGKEVLSVG